MLRIVNQPYLCKLNRFEESILHRLRIGVIGLNLDLFRLNTHSTGHCNNCIGRTETVNHFLTECPKYIVERAMLLVETDLSHSQKIMTRLTILEIIKQKAIVRFVLRTKVAESKQLNYNNKILFFFLVFFIYSFPFSCTNKAHNTCN